MIAHINGNGFSSTTLTAMLDGLLATLEDTSLDPAFRAYALSIPTEREMAQALTPFDPESIHRARETLLDEIAGHLKNALQKTYDGISLKSEFSPDAKQAGQRSLRNCALRYLARTEENKSLAHDLAERDTGNNFLARKVQAFSLAYLGNIDTATNRFTALLAERPRDKKLAQEIRQTLEEIGQLETFEQIDIQTRG